MKKLELVPGIKGYFVKTLLSALRPGAFFAFDKDSDLLFRLVEVRFGTVFFHGIANDVVEPFNQPVDNCLVFLVKEIDASYSEGLKKEFMLEMKKRIISRLSSWEIAFTRMPDVSEVKFEDLKSQQTDNPDMMEDMIGFPAANIIRHLKII